MYWYKIRMSGICLMFSNAQFWDINLKSLFMGLLCCPTDLWSYNANLYTIRHVWLVFLWTSSIHVQQSKMTSMYEAYVAPLQFKFPMRTTPCAPIKTPHRPNTNSFPRVCLSGPFENLLTIQMWSAANLRRPSLIRCLILAFIQTALYWYIN